MVDGRKQQRSNRRFTGEGPFYALILVAGAAARVPFTKAFDLVSYDGTYYINHARSFFDGSFSRSGFPIGYPVLVALFGIVVRDWVRAAQAVSLLACLGSLVVFYMLGRRFVGKVHAFLGGLFLAITPLGVRLSMTTMSESLYVFFLLSGLLLYMDRKDVRSGLLLGAAAVTRPEAVGVFAILALLRLRRPRRMILIGAAFIAVYSVNVAVQSAAAGRLVILPKAGLFGTGAVHWKLREVRVEPAGGEEERGEAAGENGGEGVIAYYTKRLPAEIILLARHATPAILLLALFGIYRRRSHLLAALAPFLVFPLFTLRSEPRFIYPYLPVLILYAVIGIERIGKECDGPAERLSGAVDGRDGGSGGDGGSRSARRFAGVAALVLGIVSVGIGVAVNREQLTRPVSGGYEWAKRLGTEFAARAAGRAGVGKGAGLHDRGTVGEGGPRDTLELTAGAYTIADRKPYFAFYARGAFVEIPLGDYDGTIGYLYGRGIDYLVLHTGTIQRMRPKLGPLLHDESAVRGEMRYSLVFFEEGTVSIFMRERSFPPLKRRRLVSADGSFICQPAWSPDGAMIAYRRIDADGGGGIYVVPAAGGSPELVSQDAAVGDQISWSPDSKRIAFAGGIDGSLDLYAADLSGGLERITAHESADLSPSWSRDGEEIFFCSDRSGADEIWSVNLVTGTLLQLTRTGDARCPAVSPDGEKVAFLVPDKGLFVYERKNGNVYRIGSECVVSGAPAWSPDGACIAFSAGDRGTMGIYLVASEGGSPLLLTLEARREGMPAWSPDASSIASVSRIGGGTAIDVLSGVPPRMERVIRSYPVRVHGIDRRSGDVAAGPRCGRLDTRFP